MPKRNNDECGVKQTGFQQTPPYYDKPRESNSPDIYNYRESNADGVVTLAFFWKEPTADEIAEMGLPERPEGVDSYSLADGWYQSDAVPRWAIDGAHRVEELQWLETKYAMNAAFEVPNV
jgi:hypothetical protein